MARMGRRCGVRQGGPCPAETIHPVPFRGVPPPSPPHPPTLLAQSPHTHTFPVPPLLPHSQTATACFGPSRIKSMAKMRPTWNCGEFAPPLPHPTHTRTPSCAAWRVARRARGRACSGSGSPAARLSAHTHSAACSVCSARAVAYMRQRPDDFQPFIEDDEAFGDYLERMAQVGQRRPRQPPPRLFPLLIFVCYLDVWQAADGLRAGGCAVPCRTASGRATWSCRRCRCCCAPTSTCTRRSSRCGSSATSPPTQPACTSPTTSASTTTACASRCLGHPAQQRASVVLAGRL